MEYNGKVAKISAMYLNSLKIMVIKGIKEGEVVNEYLDIDSPITYKPYEGDAIEGVVKSYKSMMSTDNVLVDVPLNSIVASTSFEGRTVKTTNDNIDLMYDANDIQDHTSITNTDGFENIKETDITVQGQSSINIIPQRGVTDGLSFVVNQNTTIPVEAGETLPRIDLVMIRKDQLNRTASIIMRKGNASNNPVMPTYEQTTKGIYELPIYSVRIGINQTVLSRLNITDMRNPTSKENTATKSELNTVKQYMEDRLRGIIMAFAGNINKIPTNALFCDGREISRTTYARVFEKIGTTWGAGNGTTTFNIPDGRSGVLMGAGYSNQWTHQENPYLAQKIQTHMRRLTGDFMSKDRYGTNYGTTDASNLDGVFKFGVHTSGYNVTGGLIPASLFYSIGLDSSLTQPSGNTFTPNAIGVNFIIFV